VQGRALVVSQQLAGEAEAERLPPRDRHRRQGVGVACHAAAAGEGGSESRNPWSASSYVSGARSLSRKKSRSRATVRRETPNSAMNAVLFGGSPPADPSRTIWTMRRIR